MCSPAQGWAAAVTYTSGLACAPVRDGCHHSAVRSGVVDGHSGGRRRGDPCQQVQGRWTKQVGGVAVTDPLASIWREAGPSARRQLAAPPGAPSPPLPRLLSTGPRGSVTSSNHLPHPSLSAASLPPPAGGIRDRGRTYPAKPSSLGHPHDSGQDHARPGRGVVRHSGQRQNASRTRSVVPSGSCSQICA